MKRTHKFAQIFVLTLIFSLIAVSNVGAIYSESNSTSSVVNSITVSGSGDDITWSVDGYSAKGFKVVWSKNANPTYPLRSGDKYHYYSSPDKRSDSLTAFNGSGTYYVRVCEYLGGACGKYSNQITLSLGDSSSKDYDDYDDSSENEDVDAITMSADGTSVTWSVDGYSKNGFKVVWSKSANPTYPTRSSDRYVYYSNSGQRNGTIKAFDGDGTYYVRVCEYLGGSCGVYSNQVQVQLESQEKEAVACTMEYAPVCGKNGKTYSNKCMLNAAGAGYAHGGECKKDEQIQEIEEKAEYLYDDKLDLILAELNELRDLVKEQQAQIKYLTELKDEVSALSSKVESMINNFIAYGVDANTEKLGAGERAAVMYSFKDAFGKLPETEDEMADAIKIANGRWPSENSAQAENRAKESFEYIYGREADMSNPNDNAAVTIMAYGLRQRAENRNLNSEKAGIKIFESIYGHTPSNTEEWNIMQAITYSGATK